MIKSDYMRGIRGNVWRVINSLSGALQISISYLGLIVFVTAILAVSVPSVREHASDAYKLVVVALDSSTYKNDLTQSPDQHYVKNSSLDDSDSSFSFTQALADSEENSSIPGVTKAQAAALRSYLARKYSIANSVAGAIISTVFKVAREKDLDPQLVLAVIAIESRYNPFAESHVGAQGLMQVMTRVHKDKFEAMGEGPLAAVHPLANIQVGTQILHDCISRRGSIDGGLACYVGATGPSDGGYGNKVKAEWRRIALASGIPIKN